MQILNITPPTTQLPIDTVSIGTFNRDGLDTFTFFIVPRLNRNLRDQLDLTVAVRIINKYGSVTISVTER